MSTCGVRIRPENARDADAIGDLIKRTYADVPYSDHREHLMVERLRHSAAFLPELSLVAEVGGKMVGHVLLSKICISGSGRALDSLALAPLSVMPAFQNQGVGSSLLTYAHERATDLGFGSIVVVGNPDYYPKFGYKPLRSYGLEVDFDVREDHCFAIELVEGHLAGLGGLVEYPAQWMELVSAPKAL